MPGILVTTWEAASTPLVALVDSDTVWAPDVAELVAMPFVDPEVGAVTARPVSAQSRWSSGRTVRANSSTFFTARACGMLPNWNSAMSTPAPSSRIWARISRAT